MELATWRLKLVTYEPRTFDSPKSEKEKKFV